MNETSPLRRAGSLYSFGQAVRTSPFNDIFPAGGAALGTYTYDANGNMTADSRDGLHLGYNFLNLVREVRSGSATGAVKARYTWSSDGSKLRVRAGAIDATHGFDYLGSLTYTSSPTGALSLESVNFAGGVIRMTNNIQEINYFLTDHLGSVRAIVDASGVVKERNDYYSFGAKHVRSDHPQNDNRFKYNGKEEQVTGSLPYLDYGARKYDSRIGRWFNIDPLAEKYYPVSPFAYVANSPIKFIDPDGMRLDWFYNDQTGDVYYNSSYTREDVGKGPMTGDGWHWLGPNGMFDYIYNSTLLHSPGWIPSEIDRDLSVLINAGVNFFSIFSFLGVGQVFSAMIRGENAINFMEGKGYTWTPVQVVREVFSSKLDAPAGMGRTIRSTTNNITQINEKYTYTQYPAWLRYRAQTWLDYNPSPLLTTWVERGYYYDSSIHPVLNPLWKFWSAMSGYHYYQDVRLFNSWSDYESYTKGEGHLFRHKPK
jgi:RHS repeat-associated protein